MKHSQTIHHSWLHNKVGVHGSLNLEARVTPKFSSSIYMIKYIFLFHRCNLRGHDIKARDTIFPIASA